MAQSNRPNILFIMSDDHAAHAMSCYSNLMKDKPVINETPNIDRIAEEGILMNNCFCTNSLCAPSRATILTGTYSHINGVTTIHTKLDQSQPTLPKLLKRAGYQTAMIGKWHLGYDENHLPVGFDHYCILMDQGVYFNPGMILNGKKTSFHGYTTDIITDLSLEWLENRNPEDPFMLMCHHKAPHRKWHPDEKHKHLYDDVDIPLPKTFNDDYSGRRMAEFAKMRVESDFCALDLKILPPPGNGFKNHIPVPEDIEGYEIVTAEEKTVSFDSKQELKQWNYQRYIKDYLRCIASLDDNVGRILDYLEAEGLEENTIVVYTSDQGFFLGDHGWYDKRFMYEESLRMPFLIKYPKTIPAGVVSDQIVLNVDFAQTFLDYAGVSAPERMQGESMRPVLELTRENNSVDSENLKNSESVISWRDAFYYRYFMLRSQHEVSPHYGIRTHKYKLIYFYGGEHDPGAPKGVPYGDIEYPEPEWQLFDLDNDPYELINLYDDPAYAKVQLELKRKLHELQKKCGDKPVTEI